MIERSKDPTFINSVANDPNVLPFLRPSRGQRVDYSAIAADERNYVLQGEYGGIVLYRHIPGFYEIHSQCLPKGRGPWMLNFARECVNYMFCRTEAVELFTRCPSGNVAALALTRACGFQFEHRMEEGMIVDGQPVRVDLYRQTIQDWVKTAPHLPEKGQWFHEKLESEYIRLGMELKVHPEDEWHNRHVGAAISMALSGQVLKGVSYMNRWAGYAIAPQVRLISQDPVVINITDCDILVQDGDFRVMGRGQVTH